MPPPPFAPLAAVKFKAVLGLNIDDVMATPESQQTFTTNYKQTLATQTGTTPDAVEIISIAAGSIVVDSRILLLDEASVQAVSTQLKQSSTSMSAALATTFNTTADIDAASVSVEILISPPPPAPPPVAQVAEEEDAAGMNIGLVAGGTAAGGVLLLVGVAVGMYCRAKPSEPESNMFTPRPPQAAGMGFSPPPVGYPHMGFSPPPAYPQSTPMSAYPNANYAPPAYPVRM
jgi:hypothetical protein